MQRCISLFLVLSFCSTAVAAQQATAFAKDGMGFSKSLRLPANYYTQHLGFFCKTELRLQKFTALPVFFRLGSKDYVDYLERKPNAGRPIPDPSRREGSSTAQGSLLQPLR